MDDDDYRRGKLTAHKKFGEHLAVLSGDALQSLAYEIMLTKTRRVAPAQLLAALRILLEAIGPKGVVAGQVLDLEAEGQVISFLRLKQIHAQKTGALIRAAVKMAAVLCHASEKTAAKLDLYARHLGLLFQIADDLLDYTSSFAKMGKNPGSDLKQGKATYVSVLGQEQAGVFLLKEGQAARAALKFLGKRAARLQQLVDYAAAREG
jgi:geranylgeranyl pyrophosphate synthase